MALPYFHFLSPHLKWSIAATLLCLSPLAFLSCVHTPPPAVTQIGDPLPGLTKTQLSQFEQGKTAFLRVFSAQDGLGPLFNINGTSCGECHEDPVAGGVGNEVETHATRFVAPSSCDPLFEEGGPVIQQDATPLLRAKGILKEEIPSQATGQAQRSSPPLFGFGLIDAIPEKSILAYEDPNDSDHDGISGRANRTIDGRVGKFGRKAAVATLFEFNAGAFPAEMGVTTPLSPREETLNGHAVPPDTDPAPDPEISQMDIQRVTDFIRFLAPPPPKLDLDRAATEEVKRGKKLFAEIKCAGCHIPEFQTGPSDIPALDRKQVAVYSDLLLHDMGPELADICLEGATPAEFRTEMLMGLRFREKFLHDGSAGSVQQAIERHAAEGKKARDAFAALNDKDKAALLAFLATI